ncbi:MFS transporter [Maritimibacter sp. HL-12]|uniref:MFS transporter n=1 Tax=Maritimibacter sp. HL-12 TaxID=1162418 RepID=UPI000A0F1729|nr:MFS transporter [Maritimibacter sp. HL-12]SMH35122.1 hypothetical protein SAMN05661107_0589 [Maritimibacter sp. HL-12]
MIEQLFTRIAGRPELDHEAGNGLRHVAALSMTKLADGLIDPKLVLAWLLNALGVPAAFISALVPIREAGALLPQVFLAAVLARMRQRRWMWAAGTLAEGAAAAFIALTALTLTGAAAGWAFVVALGVLAIARAAASVSYKDVLGKTVGRSRRGAVTGAAGSLSSAGVVIFAALLILDVLEGTAALAGAVALAALLFVAAAVVFATLREMPSETGDRAGDLVLFRYFREDRNFTRFVVARGFLTATALSPPYIVLLGGDAEGALGQLGALVIASALASFLSSWIWGRFADRSSRKVLIAAGLIGAGAMGLAVALGTYAAAWALPGALFVLMVAHHGVRNGRSTYLVDIAPDDARGGYAAASNTAIGVLLLVSGLFGGALSMLGPVAALLGFAALAVIGALVALGLKEAE